MLLPSALAAALSVDAMCSGETCLDVYCVASTSFRQVPGGVFAMVFLRGIVYERNLII